MLRITVHDKPPVLAFQLEGELAGPWVRELNKSWQRALAGQPEPVLRVPNRILVISCALLVLLSMGVWGFVRVMADRAVTASIDVLPAQATR